MGCSVSHSITLSKLFASRSRRPASLAYLAIILKYWQRCLSLVETRRGIGRRLQGSKLLPIERAPIRAIAAGL